MEDFRQCEKLIRWYFPRHVVFRIFPVKNTPPKVSKKFSKISQNFPKYYLVLNIMIKDEYRVIWALRHLKAFMWSASKRWLNLKVSHFASNLPKKVPNYLPEHYSPEGKIDQLKNESTAKLQKALVFFRNGNIFFSGM